MVYTSPVQKEGIGCYLMHGYFLGMSMLRVSDVGRGPEAAGAEAEEAQVGEFGLPVHVNRTQFHHQVFAHTSSLAF